MGDEKSNTNLASEYYVMSMLHRLGITAVLTLNNKKAIDIIVHKNGKTLTIDVKGLQGKSKSNFPFVNCTTREKYHYYIFISFLDKIKDPTITPDVYIIPSLDIDKIHKELGGRPFVYKSPKQYKGIYYSTLEKLKKKYLNKWSVFK